MIAGDESGQIVTYDGDNFTPGFYFFLLVNSFSVAVGICLASWLAPIKAEAAARILFRIMRWILAVAVVILLYDCVSHINGLRGKRKLLPDEWWIKQAVSGFFFYLSIFLGGYLGLFLSKKIGMRKPYSMNDTTDVLDANLVNDAD